MANPASTSFHDQSATLRQLKLLVLLLVLSNVGIGLFSFYVVRKTDQRYSEVISRSVPVLNDLQELAVSSIQVMRLTQTGAFTNATANEPRLAEAANALQQERNHRQRMLASEWIATASSERAELLAAGNQFTQTANDLLALLKTGQLAEANRLRDDTLRPAFDRYLLAATKAADLLEAESRRANDDASVRSSRMSTLLLGAASWPVVLLVGLLLLTALFVLVLMVLFRGREMSDTP